MKIKDRAEYKSKPRPVTLPPSSSVRDAINVMGEKNIGSVVITNPDDTVVGILTERDLMLRVLYNNLNPDSASVADVMTTEVRVANEEDDLLDWMRIMSNERFRHLPVVDDQGRIVNMFSQGDFVSYTWPQLFERVKETAKATLGAGYQILLIVLAMLLYALVINLMG